MGFDEINKKIKNTEALTLRKLMEYKLVSVWEKQKSWTMMEKSKRFIT
jgi:hypothetical protein